MPSNHLILYRPLLLLPSIFPSIRVFSNKSVLLIRWPKYWSFSFSISPFNEFSGLISFRIDWLDLLAVQGILKSLLQHHSSKASILQCSAFLIVQLSYPYMTAGKTVAVTTCFLGIHRVFKEEQDLCKNRCWVLTKYYSPCLFFMFMSVESVIPPTISSSVVPFSSRLQSFPASGSFPISQFFSAGDQSGQVYSKMCMEE